VPHLGQVDIFVKMWITPVIYEDYCKLYDYRNSTDTKKYLSEQHRSSGFWSFVNLNRLNELGIKDRNMFPFKYFEQKTQGIPFVDKKVFEENRTIRITS
jgi:hypothetical protein